MSIFPVSKPPKFRSGFGMTLSGLFFALLQAQNDISNLKNIAGETGKKLSSLASTLMTDLQDRIL
jgi:hypothetical protein